MPLIFDEQPSARTQLRAPPSQSGVISWNTSAPHGAIAVRVRLDDGRWSTPMPYVRWDERSRVSLGGSGDGARFEIDLLMTTRSFTAIEVETTAQLDALALATPPRQHPYDGRLDAIEIDVPPRSQYDGERGSNWCSPASLAMLLSANGIDMNVDEVAAAIYDEAYRGTGNWAFNVAFASRFGLRAFVAFLRDLAHARMFLEAGVPLALSIAWRAGQLDNPPLAQSDGHIAVLRGFDGDGNPIVNDPAQQAIRVVYPRAQFEKLWLQHRGIAYVMAPPHIPTVELANA